MPHLLLMTCAHRKSLATLAGQSRPRGMGKASLTAPGGVGLGEFASLGKATNTLLAEETPFRTGDRACILH